MAREFQEPAAVAQEWFYVADERSVGPLSSEGLIEGLRRMVEPGKTLVWREGFDAWQKASDVAELAGRLGKPPADAVVAPDPALDRWTAADADAEDWDDDVVADTKRRWPKIVAAVVVAVAIIGGAIYASRLFRAADESEFRVALPTGVAQLQPQPEPQPAKPDPAAALAQLTEKVAQAATATDALALKLWATIEPQTMQSPPNLATASRDDLEGYLRDLMTAEANTSDAAEQYAALLDAERALIEEAGRSSGLDEAKWSDLLAAVGDRHAASRQLAGRMLQARADLYQAMQAVQQVVIGDFGKYKVDAEGQLRFSSKAVTNRAAAASERVSAANQTLDGIEALMVQARRASPQAAEPAWKDMVIQERAAGAPSGVP